MNRRHRFGAEGYTLIELIISITILAAITGAITAVFITTFNGNANASQRIHESNDAQLIAGFWTRDAQAAGGTNPFTGAVDGSLGVLPTNDDGGCVLGGGAAVIGFKWKDWTAVNVSSTRVANYVYRAATHELERRTCTNNVADGVVSLAAQVASPPTTACLPAGACPGMPDTVTITVNERSDHGTSPYTFTLSATVRPQTQALPGITNSTGSPLLALGSSTCSGGTATGIAVGGTTNVVVNGQAVVNAVDVGGCTAMTRTNSTQYSANGTSLLTGGTCSGNLCPATTTEASPIGNPFATLTPPSTSGCGGGSNPPLVAGHYSPGTYPQPLSVVGAATFDPGTYVFCNGVALSSGANVTALGVFFYIAGGTFSVNAQATLTMTAPSGGAYAGILIWNATTNTLAINGGASVTTYGGAIYSPNADVQLNGNQAMNVGIVVAKRILFSGTATTTIIGTGPGVPGAPPLTAVPSPTTLRQVSLSWLTPPYTGTTPITSYEYRADTGGGFGAWTNVGLALSANHTCATSDHTSPTCTYQVHAINSIGAGASSTASATGLIDNAAPAPTVTAPASGVTTAATTILSGTAGTATGDGTLITVRIYAGATCSGSAQTVTTNRTAGTWTVPSPVMTSGAKAVCASQDDWTTGPTNTGTSATRTFTVDATAPTVTSVVLTNANGQVAKGDSVAITFSEAINPASLCLGWNGTSRNSITVTITNNDPTTANNDSLTVTDSGCAFNFGKINLGTPNWVTATSTYSGNGGNASTAAFSLANTKLTVVLGAGTSGTAGIPTQTVIYTPSPVITDAVGNAISGAYSFITQRF